MMRILISFLLIIVSVVSVNAAENLSDLLPTDNAVEGWLRSGEPESFKGENLFIMIDGGADIYHEYGFKQVVSQGYSNASSASVTVEIYQMASPAAAYGMYSFKIGTEGQSVTLGQAAFLEEYYINVWQGDLLMTIIGSDAKPATVAAIQRMAGMIADSYPVSGSVPELAKQLNQEPLGFSRGRYILGDLAVINSYVFDSDNIFHVREGMIGQLGENMVFVLKYLDAAESRAIYDSALAKMTSGIRFSHVDKQEQGTLLTGRKQEQVMVSNSGAFIVIMIGDSRTEIEEWSNRLLDKLGP